MLTSSASRDFEIKTYVGVVEESEWKSLLLEPDDFCALDRLFQIPSVEPRVVAELFWGRFGLKVMNTHHLPYLFFKVHQFFHHKPVEEVLAPFKRLQNFELPSAYELRQEMAEFLTALSFEEADPIQTHVDFFAKVIETLRPEVRPQWPPLWNEVSGSYRWGRSAPFIEALTAQFFSVEDHNPNDLVDFYVGSLNLESNLRNSLFERYRTKLFTPGMLLTLFPRVGVSLRASLVALDRARFSLEDGREVFKKLFEIYSGQSHIDFEDKEILFIYLNNADYACDDDLMEEVGEDLMRIIQMPYTYESLRRTVLKLLNESSSRKDFRSWKGACEILEYTKLYYPNYIGYCRFFKKNVMKIVEREQQDWIGFLEKLGKELEEKRRGCFFLENEVLSAVLIVHKLLSDMVK